MEAAGCAYGSFQRAGTIQFGQEKKGAGGDHFAVDDLLDFSNEEEEEEDDNGAGGEDTATGISSAGSSTANALDSCNSSSAADDVRLSGDLCEPYDDLAELEWLSNFVEESFSSEDVQKLQLLSGIKSVPGSGSGSGSGSSLSLTRGDGGNITTMKTAPVVPLTVPEPSAVPGKARSKRSRGMACSWSSRLLILSPTSSLDSGPILLDPSPRRKAPKPARKAEAAPDGRKCLHCATDRTPQWRTGPMGPKTLCNACGVRYKSGRLVPEYRPAASPTFTMSKHSNSHRKVLELRRQKEMIQAQAQQLMMVGPASGPDEFLIHHRMGPGFPSDS